MLLTQGTLSILNTQGSSEEVGAPKEPIGCTNAVECSTGSKETAVLACRAAAATDAATSRGTGMAQPEAETTALVSLKVVIGVLHAMQSIVLSPAALRHPVRHGLHTKCEQGERRAALERIRPQAVQVAEGSVTVNGGERLDSV